jgi:hypothetical protein
MHIREAGCFLSIPEYRSWKVCWNSGNYLQMDMAFKVLTQLTIILSYSHVLRYATNLIPSPFWNVMHCRLVVSHQQFRTPFSPNFNSQAIQEDCLMLGWPEGMVTNNQSMPHNIPEQLRSHLHHIRHWKSCSQFVRQPHSPSGMWQYVA